MTAVHRVLVFLRYEDDKGAVWEPNKGNDYHMVQWEVTVNAKGDFTVEKTLVEDVNKYGEDCWSRSHWVITRPGAE